MAESLMKKVNWLSQSKLPEKVKIGPYTYKIILCKKGDKRLKSKKDEGVFYGRINHKKLSIYIAENQEPQVLNDTLLHEIMHGVFAAVGGWASGVEEEKVVSMFTTMTLDTLRKGKNPDLARFLFNL